jgi:hypothetical protein
MNKNKIYVWLNVVSYTFVLSDTRPYLGDILVSNDAEYHYIGIL